MVSTTHSIQSRLLASWTSKPQARALGFSDDGQQWQWWTREETHQRALGAADFLHRAGLRPGSPCILVLDSDATCCALLLGALLNNALPVLVAPPIIRGLHSNLRQVLQHVAQCLSTQVPSPNGESVQLLVSRDGFRQEAEEVAAEVPRLRPVVLAHDATLPMDGNLQHQPPSGDDLAAFQLTSGTTGFPRICAWRQDRVLAAVDGMVDAMQLNADDLFINWTPLYHDMGLVNNFLLCMTHGIPLGMLPTQRFVADPATWLRALSSTRATTTWSPNFGFALTAQRVSDQEIEDLHLDSVRGFWNAAERIHLDTLQAFHRRFAPLGVSWQALKTNFGCAENIGGATFSNHGARWEQVDASQLHERGIATPVVDAADQPTVDVVSAGKGHPQLQVHILDDLDQPLPDGHVGQVALDTPSRMLGYLGDPDASRSAFSSGLLKTGDLGYLRDGELFWTGRAQERINLHGKKYDPSDFESTLFQVPFLRPGCFAVFGVDDVETGTQQLVIVAELKDREVETPQKLPRKVRQAVVQGLGVAAWDIVLLPLGSMSKTSSGKRRHRHYRLLYSRGELEPLASLRIG